MKALKRESIPDDIELLIAEFHDNLLQECGFFKKKKRKISYEKFKRNINLGVSLIPSLRVRKLVVKIHRKGAKNAGAC